MRSGTAWPGFALAVALGRVGYNHGWPHPLGNNSTSGPGSCPNGLMTGTPWQDVGAVYCYTSLEQALQDHTAPPFLQLSPRGWENPPAP